MREIAPGIWHWKARHPGIGMEVSSYFLPAQGVLLDPLVPDSEVDRLEELGPPREILLTNRHHWRDCEKVAERFGLREAYGRLAAELAFDNLLVAHGDPVVGGAREALREFSEA